MESNAKLDLSLFEVRYEQQVTTLEMILGWWEPDGPDDPPERQALFLLHRDMKDLHNDVLKITEGE